MTSAPDCLTEKMDKDLIEKLTEKTEVSQVSADKEESMKNIIGETCAICYEDFTVQDKTKCKSCRTCANALHTHCINIWLRTKQTCPLCRSAWQKPIGNEKDDTALAKFSSVIEHEPHEQEQSIGLTADLPQSVVDLTNSPEKRNGSTNPISSSSEAFIDLTSSPQHRITSNEVKRLYNLSDDEIAGLPTAPIIDSTQYSHAMQLYYVKDVEELVLKKSEEKGRREAAETTGLNSSRNVIESQPQKRMRETSKEDPVYLGDHDDHLQ
jgi:hypothetical protein